MEPHSLLLPGGVIAELRVGSRHQALRAVCAHAAELVGRAQEEVLAAVLARERLGSTDVGRGVAIPHGKLAQLDRVCGVFARLAAPVDHDAPDGRAVDLIFLLLAPHGAGAIHLRALALVARTLADEALATQLRASRNAEVLLSLLVGSGLRARPEAGAA